MNGRPEFPLEATEHRGKCPDCGGVLLWLENVVRCWAVEDAFVARDAEPMVSDGEPVLIMEEDHEDGEPQAEWIECSQCRHEWRPSKFHACWSWDAPVPDASPPSE